MLRRGEASEASAPCHRSRDYGARRGWQICVQQRHHPHAKFKPAHRAGQSLCLHFSSTLPIPAENHNCNLQSDTAMIHNNIV